MVTGIVLLSDPSKEFTGNASARFKVRLLTPLTLTDGNWEVGLLSLSMPATVTNQTGLHVSSDSTPVILLASSMLMASPEPLGHAVTISIEVLKVFRITNRVELMKAIIETLDWKQNYEIQRLQMEVENVKWDTFRWDGDIAVLECKDHNDKRGVPFWNKATLAKKMGG